MILAYFLINDKFLSGLIPEKVNAITKLSTIQGLMANLIPPKNDPCRLHGRRSSYKRANVDDDVFWRKDGTSFPVECTSTPVIEDGRITLGAVVTF